eukprot:766869-Hanusia_phi.AAC.4
MPGHVPDGSDLYPQYPRPMLCHGGSAPYRVNGGQTLSDPTPSTIIMALISESSTVGVPGGSQ